MNTMECLPERININIMSYNIHDVIFIYTLCVIKHVMIWNQLHIVLYFYICEYIFLFI